MPEDSSQFASAKLREYIRGELDKPESDNLLPHTGVVDPGGEAHEMLTFLELAEMGDSRPAEMLRQAGSTSYVGQSVDDVSSFVVGLTDREVDISQSQALAKIARSLINEGAPYVGVWFGAMNRGKTGHALLWLELWRELVPLKYGRDDPVVVSNMTELEAADYTATDVEELRRLVFGDEEWWESEREEGVPPVIEAERPVWWHFDEASKHMDARTYGYEVPNEYLPLVKKMAKVNCDASHLGHSGMDIHADMRRRDISTEFIFKTAVKSAEVYEAMHEDQGVELKYELADIPETSIDYDPDDFSPWNW